jgi:hypothetical protein
MDVVKINKNGKPEKFYDMKFSEADKKAFEKDKERKKAYEKIAERYTSSKSNFIPFDVEERCGCLRKKQEEEQRQQQEAQEQPKSLWQRFKEMLPSPKPPASPTPFPQPSPMPLPVPLPFPPLLPI